MDSVTLLHEQLRQAHEVLEGTMEGVTPEMANWMPPGKANSIAATYAHVVLSEDMLVNGMLKQQQPMFAGEWANKTGASEMMPMENWAADYFDWTRRVQVDLPAMRAYARAVYPNTGQYIASLTPEDLDRTLDLSSVGMGQQTLGSAIGMLVIGHANNIAGEISCLKGLQGQKGYPF